MLFKEGLLFGDTRPRVRASTSSPDTTLGPVGPESRIMECFTCLLTPTMVLVAPKVGDFGQCQTRTGIERPFSPCGASRKSWHVAACAPRSSASNELPISFSERLSSVALCDVSRRLLRYQVSDHWLLSQRSRPEPGLFLLPVSRYYVTRYTGTVSIYEYVQPDY
jgi:hypothetical protein